MQQRLFEDSGSLSERLERMHQRILDSMPEVERVALTLYDQHEQLLKTFVHSTHKGTAIRGYQCKLALSPSLQHLADHAEVRTLDDITKELNSDSPHTTWLLEQGYRSSFTVPLYHNGKFIGFVFFNSSQPGIFNATVQRDLLLFCNLISMLLSAELSAVDAVLSSVNIARDFTHLRDFETGAHLERMSRYAHLIARGLAEEKDLTDETVEYILLFAPLHDIGKIGIPDRILLKPGRLNTEERRIMQQHVVKGIEIVNKIIGKFSLQQLPDSELMLNIVGCHHEFLDGTGYPQGLKGDEIPLEARIITVADIFDALTSARPYKKTWSINTALEELKKMRDAGKLDPDCVRVLLENKAQIIRIAECYRDSDDSVYVSNS